MKHRITWKPQQVVSVALRENLFTLAQMLMKPYMRFFDICSTNDNWQPVDLSGVDELFTVSIGRDVLSNLKAHKVNNVNPSQKPLNRYWIKPHLHRGGFPFKNGMLVELDPSPGANEWRVIKPHISLDADRDLVERFEMTNMWGTNDLTKRLVTYFDTGDLRDTFKDKVFGIIH